MNGCLIFAGKVRNYLLGHDGDNINALFAVSGHKLRLILNTLALLFAQNLVALLEPAPKPNNRPPLPAPKINRLAFFTVDKVLRVALEVIANARMQSPARHLIVAPGLFPGSAVDAYLRRNGKQGKGKRRVLLDAP